MFWWISVLIGYTDTDLSLSDIDIDINSIGIGGPASQVCVVALIEQLLY